MASNAMKNASINWNWRDTGIGRVIAAIPIAIIVTGQVEAGLPMLIRSLPAAAVAGYANPCIALEACNNRTTFRGFFDAGSFIA